MQTVRLRRPAPRAGGAPPERTTRCSWASASRRSPRCAAWRRPGCSARWRYGAGGWEAASIRMLATGKVEVITGASAHGQGHETAFSQIVADQLGVPFEDVEILHGDTQVSPKGLDTYGSRSLAVGGIAIVKAAREGGRQGEEDRRAPARGVRGRPRVRRRRVHASGAPTRARPSRRSRSPRSWRTTTRRTWSRSLDSDAVFDPENFSFPHGTHLAAMEVDTETGRVEPAQVRLRGRRRHA